jgi:uncharacterized protein YwqG
MQLPAAMERFRADIVDTRQPFVRLVPRPSRATSRWESKVGGLPYLPMGQVWPTAPDGRELFFLAQINFAHMPPLAPFPTQGIVQFFIYDDDLYGMDFDDGHTPDTFRVVWHPTVVEDDAQQRHDLDTLRDYDLLPHHPDESYPLDFEVAEEYLPPTDYQFAKRFGADFFAQFGEREWDVQEEYSKKVRSDGHKIGGYAYFLQDDPRKPKDPMLLLLQLDSDELMDLMWGDMGVGHFFIRESDLVRGDFSRVLYDWDCM